MAMVFVLSTVLAIVITTRAAITAVSTGLTPTALHLYLDEHAIAYEFEGEGFSLEMLANKYPTVEDIGAIGNLSYVGLYDVYFNTFLFSREFEWITPVVDIDGLSERLINILENVLFGERSRGAVIERIPVMGVSEPNLIAIEMNQIAVVEGRIFTAEEISNGQMLAVIPSVFAEHNGLYVGATMTLESIVHDTLAMKRADLPIESHEISVNWHDERFYTHHQILEFEVIGIFDVTHQLDHKNFFGRYSWEIGNLFGELTELYNRIYLPFTVADDILRSERVAHAELYGNESQLAVYFWDIRDLLLKANFITNATFILEPPYDLVAFREAANELLPQFWYVDYSIDISSKIILTSASIMLEVANLTLVLIVGIMLIALPLTFMLSLKTIKFNGKKSKLGSQFLTEILLASTLGIGLALLTGDTLARITTSPMFEQILIHQIAESRGSATWIDVPLEHSFNLDELLLKETLRMYQPSFDDGTIVIFLSTSATVILISTGASIMQMIKLKREG